MFPGHQPAHVGEEESADRVVRVGVRVGELVVDPMVADPFVYVILEGHRLEQHQKYAHRQTGVVGSVRPQSVSAGGYAYSAETPDDEYLKKKKLNIMLNICFRWPVCINASHRVYCEF